MDNLPPIIQEAQESGQIMDVTYSTLETSVGYSISGLCPGSYEVLNTVKNNKKLNILEIGPGKGELVPCLMNGLCKHLTLIGEGHHLNDISKSYSIDRTSHKDNISLITGWFPQDLPMESTFDIIFASRVIHIGGIDIFKKHIRNIFNRLNQNGKIIIETTTPWAHYYHALWPKFLSQDPSSIEAYEVCREELLLNNLTECDLVCLINQSQAFKLFHEAGFINISCEPFRMKSMFSEEFFDTMVTIVATKP